MKVETKHNINDILFFVHDGAVCSKRVMGIYVSNDGKKINVCGTMRDLIPTGEYRDGDIKVMYQFDVPNNKPDFTYINENRVFPTKEELLASL